MVWFLMERIGMSSFKGDFMQRFERRKERRKNYEPLDQGYSRQKDKQKQRPWARKKWCVLYEQSWGPCDSHGEREQLERDKWRKVKWFNAFLASAKVLLFFFFFLFFLWNRKQLENLEPKSGMTLYLERISLSVALGMPRKLSR